MEVFHSLLIHFLFSGVIAFLLWSRKSKTVQAGRLRMLKYPLPLRLFAATTLGILITGSSLLVAHTVGAERNSSLLMLLPFVVIAFLGTIETWLTHVSYDSDHIFYNSVWKAPGTIAIDEVSHVEHSPFWGHYTINGDAGTRIRVSKYMNGVNELLGFIYERSVLTQTNQDSGNVWPT